MIRDITSGVVAAGVVGAFSLIARRLRQRYSQPPRWLSEVGPPSAGWSDCWAVRRLAELAAYVLGLASIAMVLDAYFLNPATGGPSIEKVGWWLAPIWLATGVMWLRVEVLLGTFRRLWRRRRGLQHW